MRAAALALTLALSAQAAGADEFFTLKGHGGPIMDIAVAAPSGAIATASFDNSVGLWRNREPRWLDGHEAAVNTVAFLDEGRLVSGSDDFTVRLWQRDTGEGRVLGTHKGKVMDVTVSPDRQTVASASWDGSIGLWPLAGGAPRMLHGHESGVNAVTFSADGDSLYSAGQDGTIRVWDLATGRETRQLVRHGFGVNRMVLNPEAGWLAYGAVDGVTRIVDPATGEEFADLTLGRRPILSLAADPEFRHLAVGDGEGFIMVLDTADWSIARDFRATEHGPVWALAFSADGENVDAGGLDPRVYSWPLDTMDAFTRMETGDETFLKAPETMENGERQFARKCSICHSLTPGSARRAGPTLHDLFGRRAGTVPDYRYSDRLAGSDIVWSEETINQLFELGPEHYIPGSKMPMQRIAGDDDRADLIAYLRRATKTGDTSE